MNLAYMLMLRAMLWCMRFELAIGQSMGPESKAALHADIMRIEGDLLREEIDHV